MAKSETAPRDRSKGVKLAFWLLIGFLGLFTAAVLAIFSISVYTNTKGEIPKPLRDAPSEYYQLQRATFVAPTIPAPIPAQPNPAELEARRQRYRQSTGEIDALRRSFDRTFLHSGFNSELTPAMLDWLTTHAAQLAAMHEFLKTDDRVKREELFNLSTMSSGYMFDAISRLQIWNRILTRVAQLKMKQRDYAAAREALLDSMTLIGWSSPYCTRQFTMSEFWVTSLFFANAVEDRDWPAVQFAGLPEAIEKLEIQIFDQKAVLNELVSWYLNQRTALVKQLDGPWNSTIFGWPWDSRQLFYRTNVYLPDGTEIKFPKTIRYLQLASEAMDKKKRSAEALKIFDEEQQRRIKRFQMPYAEQKATLKQDYELSQRNYKRSFVQAGPTQDEVSAEQFRIFETHVHLVRAGMLWRIDPQKARASRAENVKANPHHPWHDPFTEEPLRVDETSTETLIYSLGYTLKPEDGRRWLNTHIHVPIQ
ncbi:hypothetical protein LLG95_00065 [bacterium]|nr:hypothetical protein [bacterium]